MNKQARITKLEDALLEVIDCVRIDDAVDVAREALSDPADEHID